MLTNCEMEYILEGEDVVRMIKAQQIRWHEHVLRGREN